ncbi:MAG: biotin/lipoyl-binding protein [Chloroflexi bacterium]|nr:biotin/lipoyl-binding protein [Chloroflexota bacterium]
MPSVQYETQQGVVSVSIERGSDGRVTATVGERTYQLSAERTQSGRWVLDFDDRTVQVATAADGSRRYAQVVGGPVYALSIATPSARRRASAGAEAGRLTAQMPGQVVDVLVEPGQTVTAGQPLIVLEAMKMEIRVGAPSDGVVREVLVKEGDVVERDQQLIQIDAPDS